MTSYRSPSDRYPLLPNPVVGESILDRVLNTSHHLLLEGNGYRPRRAPRARQGDHGFQAMMTRRRRAPPLTLGKAAAHGLGSAARAYGAALQASRLLRTARRRPRATALTGRP